MIDETGNSTWAQPGTPRPEPETASTSSTASAETVGFCQDCGRPLTRETARVVGAGMFCEPCLQVRLAGGTPGRPAAPVNGPTGTLPAAPGQPSTVLAGILGFIPGVGAMYNGQFAKGIAHIAIFAILSFLSDHVSGIFGIMVAGWVFYQVFDAIYTARARRDGLPLPNTFGLNDIGERIGFVPTHPPSAPRATPPYTPPPPAPARPVADAATPAYTPVAPIPPVAPYVPAPAPNWAGYVPPAAYGQAYAVPPSPAATPGDVAFSPLNNGTPAVPPAAPARRFPAAAVWLIALGFLFLLANMVPSWQFSERWAAPVVLLMFAGWSLYRRINHLDQIRATALVTGRPYMVTVIRVPLILATLALEFTLQNLNVATVGQTWPLLLIVIGGLALADRASFHGPEPLDPGRASFSGPVPASSGASTTSGETTSRTEV